MQDCFQLELDLCCSFRIQQKTVSIFKTNYDPLLDPLGMLLQHPRGGYSLSAAVQNTCSTFSKILYGQLRRTVFRMRR